MTSPQQELKSFTGAYIAYAVDGNLIVTGREKFKNFKAIFPLAEMQAFVSRPAPSLIDDEMMYRIIGTLVSTEGFVPTAIRSEVMRLREELAESLRTGGERR